MRALLLMCLLASPITANADPFLRMEGNWKGSGWIRETIESPREQVRCRLQNSYDPVRTELILEGICVVSGKRLKLVGKIVRDGDSEAITGQWANPKGGRVVRIYGRFEADFILFTYRATNPLTGRNHARNVEWRLNQGKLRLRSTDRERPDILLSEIVFVK